MEVENILWNFQVSRWALVKDNMLAWWREFKQISKQPKAIKPDAEGQGPSLTKNWVRGTALSLKVLQNLGKQLLSERLKSQPGQLGENSHHEVDQTKHKVWESHPIFLALPGLCLKTPILFMEEVNTSSYTKVKEKLYLSYSRSRKYRPFTLRVVNWLLLPPHSDALHPVPFSISWLRQVPKTQKRRSLLW